MRSFRLIVVALMALMVAGCKTQQKVTEKETVETENNVKSDEAKTQSSVTDLSENEDVEFNQTITYWSEPDSTGKQHPLKTIDTQAKKKKKRDLNSVRTEDEKRSNSVQQRGKKQRKNDTKVVKESAGYKLVWIYGLVAVALATLITAIKMKKK